jgi:hypothetical protein
MVKGDRPDRTAEHKKKTMKTNIKKQDQRQGLQARPEQQQSTKQTASEQNTSVVRVDFAKRQENRQLPTEKVLELLKRWLPVAFERAEVVGKWIWVAFDGKQPQALTAQLSELGFHWNNRRQVWQHPCGVFKGEAVDPRSKYQTISAQEVAA